MKEGGLFFMKFTTKKLAAIGMLCAVAFVATACIHVKLVPGAPFLTYDPKDIIIAIGGFIYGPLTAVIISAIVSFIEMITISESGFIGLIMQMLATCAFTLPAAILYRDHRSKKMAAAGLAAGSVCMVIMMLLWNWLVTPFYLGCSRADVVPLLLPAILPFNAIKAVINTVLTLLVYKPVVNALRKTGLIDQR